MDLRRAILCGCRYDFFSVFQAQVTKFGNYFLSSKYTTAVDNLSYMLAAANTLATNKVSKKCVDNYYADIIPPSYHCSSLSLSLFLSLSLSLSLPFSMLCLVRCDSRATSQSLSPIRTLLLSSLRSWVEVLDHLTSE